MTCKPPRVIDLKSNNPIITVVFVLRKLKKTFPKLSDMFRFNLLFFYLPQVIVSVT